MNQALLDSIKHWEEIIKQVIDNISNNRSYGLNVFFGGEHCPLCLKYNNNNHSGILNKCHDCPIFEKTRKKFCADTPYENLKNTYTGKDFLIVAIDELQFLKSLIAESDLSDGTLVAVTSNGITFLRYTSGKIINGQIECYENLEKSGDTFMWNEWKVIKKTTQVILV
jgi:hypothetical protein